jgi:sugar (pentulose or hexulose) kinase
MQLIANICSVPVIVPHSPSAAVVLGAAMLGRFAAEVSKLGRKLSDNEQRKKLWHIMVRRLWVMTVGKLNQTCPGGDDPTWPTC